MKNREETCQEAIILVRDKAELLTKELGVKVYGFAVVTEKMEIKEGYFKMPTRYVKSSAIDFYSANKPSEAHDIMLANCVIKEHSCSEIYDEKQTEESDKIYYSFQSLMANLVSMYANAEDGVKKK